MVITSEELHRLVTSSGIDAEQEFRTRLDGAATTFVRSFEKWVEEQAMDIAKLGRRQSHRRYPSKFHEKLNGFRLSTYVKGFRTPDGGFTSARFLEIGYTEEQPTPFEKARANLCQRGIFVEDVSDPARGLGFWLRISF